MNGFFIGTDTEVKIIGLKSSEGTYVSDATIVGTLQDKKGVLVPGGDNIQFSYVVGSNGDYLAVLSSDLMATLSENRDYDLMIEATSGASTMTARMRRKAEMIQV